MTGSNQERLPDSDIWFVRAERRNLLADCLLPNGIVAMGWDIGPISSVESKKEIADRLRSAYADHQPATTSKRVREIREFNQDVGVGDAVAACEPHDRAYHLGIIWALLVCPPPELFREWPEDECVHGVTRCTKSRGIPSLGGTEVGRVFSQFRMLKHRSRVNEAVSICLQTGMSAKVLLNYSLLQRGFNA